MHHSTICAKLQNDLTQSVFVALALEFVSRHGKVTVCYAFLIQVHGEAVIGVPQLQSKAQLILLRQAETWGKLDELFQNVRCMIGFVANTQQ